MAIIYRATKGSALTNDELDGNFFDLDLRLTESINNVTVINDVTIPDLSAAIAAALANKQPLNSTLTSISDNTSVGFHAQVSEGVVAARTIQASNSYVIVTNGDGVSGNPVIGINTNEVVTKDDPYTLTNKSISGSNNTITNISLTSSVSGILPISHGGTGASSLTNARIALDVIQKPQSLGMIVAHTPFSSIARTIETLGDGLSITNGNGVNNNPRIILNSTTDNFPNSVVFRDINGNFSANVISATLSGTANHANTVTNGVYTTGSYNNPSWITGLAGTKITGIPNTSLSNSSIEINGVSVSLGGSIIINPATLGATSNNVPSSLVFRDASGNFTAGTITGSLNGTATNAVTAQTADVALRFTGANINGVFFNGTTNITVADNTKLPLAGGTLSGDVHHIYGKTSTYYGGLIENNYLKVGWGPYGPAITSQTTQDLYISTDAFLNLEVKDGGGIRVRYRAPAPSNIHTDVLLIETDGHVRANTNASNYAAGITHLNHFTTKKYVDDKVATVSSVAAATLASRLSPGAKINGTLFTGQNDITVSDNTKLPLAGGRLTGELQIYAQNDSTTNTRIVWGNATGKLYFGRATAAGQGYAITGNDIEYVQLGTLPAVDPGNLYIGSHYGINMVIDMAHGGGTFTVQSKGGRFQTSSHAIRKLFTIDPEGRIKSEVANYTSLIVDNNHLANKQYVDNRVASVTAVSTATVASRLSPGAKINGVLFTGQNDISVTDNTKVSKTGDTMTGALIMQHAGIELRTTTEGQALITHLNLGWGAKTLLSNTKGDLRLVGTDSVDIGFDSNNTGTGSFNIGRQMTSNLGLVYPLITVNNTGKLYTRLNENTYKNLIVDGTDFTTKKYVDDKVASISSVTTASRLTPGAKINGVLFTGQTDITVFDPTKLPLTGGEIPSSGYIKSKIVEQTPQTGINTSSGYLTPNWTNGTIFRVLANANFTLSPPDNMPVGAYITLIITQDTSGNKVMTPSSSYKFALGYRSLSTFANAVDVVSIFKASDTELFATVTNSYT